MLFRPFAACVGLPSPLGWDLFSAGLIANQPLPLARKPAGAALLQLPPPPGAGLAHGSSDLRGAGGSSTQLMSSTLCQIGAPAGAPRLGPGGTRTQSIAARLSVQLTKGLAHAPSENAR